MLRKSAFQLWPPATVIEDTTPALSHWSMAKPGAGAALWPASPPRLARYLDELLNAHSLSVFDDESLLRRAARGLRKQLLAR